MPPKKKTAATAVAKKTEHRESISLGEVTDETDGTTIEFVLLNGHKMLELGGRDLKREFEEFVRGELPVDLESVAGVKGGALKSRENCRVDVQDKLAGNEEANVQIQLNIHRSKRTPHTTVASVLIPDCIGMECVRQAFTHSFQNCGTVRIVKKT